MSQPTHSYTPVSNAALRWLTDPGRGVPASIRNVLIGELFSSPKAVLLGVLNGMLLNVTALLLDPSPVFACLIPATLILAAVRLLVYRVAGRAIRRGTPTPTDLNLVSAILWCVLVGALAFASMRSGVHPLQVLAASSVVGVLGAICGRNFAAPRLAVLLMGVCVVPLLAGVALSGEPWLLVLVAQIPLYFYGNLALVSRFRALSIATLQAEQDSMNRARRDPLTGVLNRLGLQDALAGLGPVITRRVVFFYLDLDGFKRVNDSWGHAAGDELLTVVAERLAGCTRVGDIVARVGGDEFVVLVQGMTPGEAPEFGERMIRTVSDPPYHLSTAPGVRVGVSIGFVCAPEDCTVPNDLKRDADTALYEAKAAGKGVQRRFRPRAAAGGPHDRPGQSAFAVSSLGAAEPAPPA